MPINQVIATKWMTGTPQYSARLHDWNPNRQIPDGEFAFSVPEGAKRVEAISLYEAGRVETSGEGN